MIVNVKVNVNVIVIVKVIVRVFFVFVKSLYLRVSVFRIILGRNSVRFARYLL